MIHLAAAQQGQHLHDGDLHGVGVFQQANGKQGTGLHLALGGKAFSAIEHAVVEEAVPAAAQGGASALGTIHLDMLASGNIFKTHGSISLGLAPEGQSNAKFFLRPSLE
jgi:hypothetical protein